MSDPTEADPHGWSLNPGYQVDFDRVPARVRVTFAGTNIGDTRGARVMYELGHTPVYYLPRDDVDMNYLLPTTLDTYCPYKGHASYWSMRVGDSTLDNAIWTYLTPHAELAALEGFLGFYWGKMEAWFEDEVAVSGPREIPGRIDTSNQLKRLFPELAAQWHPTRNPGISPYEFSACSDAVVWWRDASGHEWQERIRERALAATTLRADGDAHPYG